MYICLFYCLCIEVFQLHVYMYICIYTSTPGTHRGQTGTLDPLKLELQSIICVLWVLGPKP